MKAQIEHETTNILNSGQYADWDTFLEKNGLTQETFKQVIYETLLFNALLMGLEVEGQGVQIHLAHIVVTDEPTAQEVLPSWRPGRFWRTGRRILNRRRNQGQRRRFRLVYPGDHGSGHWTGSLLHPAPGKFSNPIPTEHGYSIIMVLEREMRELAPQLLKQKQQEALMILLEQTKAEAVIEYWWISQ